MAEREEANQKSYRRRSVSESDQDVFDLTGHKDDPRRTHRLRSVSESNHELLDPPPRSIGLSPILITLIADSTPNLIYSVVDLLMNPPGEVWVRGYKVK